MFLWSWGLTSCGAVESSFLHLQAVWNVTVTPLYQITRRHFPEFTAVKSSNGLHFEKYFLQEDGWYVLFKLLIRTSHKSEVLIGRIVLSFGTVRGLMFSLIS